MFIYIHSKTQWNDRKRVILYPVHTNMFDVFKSGLAKQG